MKIGPDPDRTERAVHDYMERFCKEYAPIDRYLAAEFQADLLLLIQAIHRDASAQTHALLEKAIQAMPTPHAIIIETK